MAINSNDSTQYLTDINTTDMNERSDGVIPQFIYYNRIIFYCEILDTIIHCFFTFSQILRIAILK